jgi:hypothetical protein
MLGLTFFSQRESEERGGRVSTSVNDATMRARCNQSKAATRCEWMVSSEWSVSE